MKFQIPKSTGSQINLGRNQEPIYLTTLITGELFNSNK